VPGDVGVVASQLVGVCRHDGGICNAETVGSASIQNDAQPAGLVTGRAEGEAAGERDRSEPVAELHRPRGRVRPDLGQDLERIAAPRPAGVECAEVWLKASP
jgi:hypothetical protein